MPRIANTCPVDLVVAASDSRRKADSDYICTGTNDEVTINLALAAASAAGGRVILRRGTYSALHQVFGQILGAGGAGDPHERSALAITGSNVTLECEPGALLSLANTQRCSGLLVIGDGLVNVRIIGFQWNGNRANNATGYTTDHTLHAGIKVIRSLANINQDVAVEHCRLTGCQDLGVFVYAVNTLVSHCRVDDTAVDGIEIADGPGTVRDCVLRYTQTGESGITLAASHGVVEACVLETLTGGSLTVSGISSNNGAQYSLIKGNRLVGDGSGTFIYNSCKALSISDIGAIIEGNTLLGQNWGQMNIDLPKGRSRFFNNFVTYGVVTVNNTGADRTEIVGNQFIAAPSGGNATVIFLLRGRASVIGNTLNNRAVGVLVDAGNLEAKGCLVKRNTWETGLTTPITDNSGANGPVVAADNDTAGA